MITIYSLPVCPYTQKVRDKLSQMGISYNELNIEEEQYEKELIERGGKRQVPYLVDDENKIEMYESDDIINYLEENYGKDKN